MVKKNSVFSVRFRPIESRRRCLATVCILRALTILTKQSWFRRCSGTGSIRRYKEGADEVETYGTSLSITLEGALVVEGPDEEIRAGK
jgi:hypothetical protein